MMIEEQLARSRQRTQRLMKLAVGSSIHVVGVCGTGTASLAALLKQSGFVVSGSDKAFYPPMGGVVRLSIDSVFEGYSASNIPDDISAVIIGNSIRSDNPEAVRALELNEARGVPYASMPEALSAFLVGERSDCPTSVVVCGTHGKTTTTAMITTMFEVAGLKPGYFIGGVPLGLDDPIRAVDKTKAIESRVVVLEGDEYDSAFFAKWPKLFSYRPDILVLTSLEFDHADIYESLEQIEEVFRFAFGLIPPSGHLVVNADNSRLVSLVQGAKREGLLKASIHFYGEAPDAEYRLVNRRQVDERRPWDESHFDANQLDDESVRCNSGGQVIELDLRGLTMEIVIRQSGVHNALNALASAVVGRLTSVDVGSIVKGVSSFEGVARRAQVRYDDGTYTFIEDFAHHPTAVRLTLEGLREKYIGRRILVFFEPRSNTSRRSVFQAAYAESFKAADGVCLMDVGSEPIYSKFGDTSLLDVEQLARDISSGSVQCKVLKSTEDFVNEARTSLRRGDVLVAMSNGSFGGLCDEIERELKTLAENRDDSHNR